VKFEETNEFAPNRLSVCCSGQGLDGISYIQATYLDLTP
jgi:hypothetical protein